MGLRPHTYTHHKEVVRKTRASEESVGDARELDYLQTASETLISLPVCISFLVNSLRHSVYRFILETVTLELLLIS